MTIPHLFKDEHYMLGYFAFCNELTKCKDVDTLKTLIVNYFKKYTISDSYVFTLRDGNNRQRYWFSDSSASKYFGDNINKDLYIEDATLEKLYKSTDPVTVPVDIHNREKRKMPNLLYWALSGNSSDEIYAMRLLAGGKTNGIIWYRKEKERERRNHLMTVIADPIAMAVSVVCREFQKDLISHHADNYSFQKTDFIGNSFEAKKILSAVKSVAATDCTVLITGESGTGKELIASAVHHASLRKNKPFIKINCATLSASFIESELFGHEAGAFTGAVEMRIGKFEAAQGGTIFLDEVGELPLELQVKLLRVLEQKEIERIGGKEAIHTDVRVVVATNKDLKIETEQGRFRSDLFYRLNVFPIHAAPLRERKKDIPHLAKYFLKEFSEREGKTEMAFSPYAFRQLKEHNWPGNIRELKHLVEKAAITSATNIIEEIQMPAIKSTVYENDKCLKTAVENECEHILCVLEKCKGKIFGNGGAAQVLGLPPSTLNSRIKKLGIKRNIDIH